MVFACNLCQYETSNKSNYNKHLRSDKHTKKTYEKHNTVYFKVSSSKCAPKCTNNYAVCENCNRSFTRNSSLIRHKNKGRCKKTIREIETLKNGRASISISVGGLHKGYVKSLILHASSESMPYPNMAVNFEIPQWVSDSVKEEIMENSKGWPPWVIVRVAEIIQQNV